MGIDPGQFLEIVRPALERGDASALAARVRERWQPRTICELLRHQSADVRRVAAITLGLVGDGSCIGCLSRALHDSDEQVNQMAEHGLWSIWFRCCTHEAAHPFLQQGIALVSEEKYELAVDRFREAIRIDPSFAEAYNQCSMAHFFLGQWRDSIAAAQQALLRQPCHFGAMATMGHCHTHLGELHEALKCYRQALSINPRMQAIERAIERLGKKLEPQGTSGTASTVTSTPSPGNAASPAPSIANPVYAAFRSN